MQALSVSRDWDFRFSLANLQHDGPEAATAKRGMWLVLPAKGFPEHYAGVQLQSIWVVR